MSVTVQRLNKKKETAVKSTESLPMLSDEINEFVPESESNSHSFQS